MAFFPIPALLVFTRCALTALAVAFAASLTELVTRSGWDTVTVPAAVIAVLAVGELI